MGVKGASRRSAAPGSQFVGGAEYGADFTQPQTVPTTPLLHSHGSDWENVPHNRPARAYRPSPASARHHEPEAASRFFALGTLPARCAILRFAEPQFRPFAPPAPNRNPHAILQEMAAVPKKEANPSVKPTHSGLRPPRAAYLKR